MMKFWNGCFYPLRQASALPIHTLTIIRRTAFPGDLYEIRGLSPSI
jgi:hypothetical protein